jgi:hypothetical protein
MDGAPWAATAHSAKRADNTKGLKGAQWFGFHPIVIPRSVSERCQEIEETSGPAERSLLRQSLHREGGVLTEDVGVDLCRLDRSMSELLLDEPKIEIGRSVEERSIRVPTGVD